MSQDYLEPTLQREEIILWRGRPSLGLVVRVEDFPFMVVASNWLGLIGWHVFGNAHVMSVPSIASMLGIAISLYILVGRFFVNAYVRRGITYTLTNKRAIIQSSLGQTFSHDVGLARVRSLQIKVGSGGTGTVRFITSLGWHSMMHRPSLHPTLDPTPQFIQISGARSVYDLARKQTVA